MKLALAALLLTGCCTPVVWPTPLYGYQKCLCGEKIWYIETADGYDGVAGKTNVIENRTFNLWYREKK